MLATSDETTWNSTTCTYNVFNDAPTTAQSTCFSQRCPVLPRLYNSVSLKRLGCANCWTKRRNRLRTRSQPDCLMTVPGGSFWEGGLWFPIHPWCWHRNYDHLLTKTCAKQYWHGGPSRTLVTLQMSLPTATSHISDHTQMSRYVTPQYQHTTTHCLYALHVWARTWDARWPVGRPSNSAEQVTPAKRSIIGPTRHCDAGKSRRVTKISHQYYSRTHTGEKKNDGGRRETIC